MLFLNIATNDPQVMAAYVQLLKALTNAVTVGNNTHIEGSPNVAPAIDPATIGFGQAAAPVVPATPPAATPPMVAAVGVATGAQPMPAAQVAAIAAANPAGIQTGASTWDANNVDARGYPWDARIHARTATKNADGTWRQKRGVEESLVEEVEVEMADYMESIGRPVKTDPVPNAPRPAAATVPTPPANVPVPPANVPVPPAATVPTPPLTPAAALTPPPSTLAPVPAAAAVPPPPAASTDAPANYNEFMVRVVGYMGQKKVTPDIMKEIVRNPALGLNELPDLQQRPDLIPFAWSLLQQKVAA